MRYLSCFCSQSVKDLFLCPLSESECKGTTFFDNGKMFWEVFLRKMKNYSRGSIEESLTHYYII